MPLGESLSTQVNGVELSVHIGDSIQDNYEDFRIDIEKLARVAGAIGIDQAVNRRADLNPALPRRVAVMFSGQTVRPRAASMYIHPEASIVLASNFLHPARLPYQLSRPSVENQTINTYAQNSIEQATRHGLALLSDPYLDAAYRFANPAVRYSAFNDLFDQQYAIASQEPEIKEMATKLKEAESREAQTGFLERVRDDVKRDVFNLGTKALGLAQIERVSESERLGEELTRMVLDSQPVAFAARRKARESRHLPHFAEVSVKLPEAEGSKPNLMEVLAVMDSYRQQPAA